MDKMSKLLRYIKIQEQFKKHYNNDLVGIGENSVQITPELFFSLFGTFGKERHANRYHYNVILNGVKVITVSSELKESEETI
jgi:hypothetical protein